jgi:hypothetical protein
MRLLVRLARLKDLAAAVTDGLSGGEESLPLAILAAVAEVEYKVRFKGLFCLNLTLRRSLEPINQGLHVAGQGRFIKAERLRLSVGIFQRQAILKAIGLSHRGGLSQQFGEVDRP